MARSLPSFLPRPTLPTPPRSDAPELLDAPERVSPPALARNLRDIRRVNRLAGGTAVVLRHLPALLRGVACGTPVTILDLATGSGDIPRALVRWGSRRGYVLRITATDASEAVLAVARRETAGYPEIAVEACDARALPYRDGEFDIVLCSLALHHFARPDAARVLAEMGRVARRGLIVNDLVRAWPGYAGAWLFSSATTTNHLTRHDAPLSVLRAYTPDELHGLARDAGLRGVTISLHPFWRMALVAGGTGDVRHREAQRTLRRSEKQEARSKKQEARSKKQEGREESAFPSAFSFLPSRFFLLSSVSSVSLWPVRLAVTDA